MKCCICHANDLGSDAPILTHGVYGHARCLCPSCAAVLETVTSSTEAEELRSSLRMLSELRMTHGDLDRACAEALSAITDEAAVRLSSVVNGTYVPPQTTDDEVFDEEDDGIPEELRETEEDRELDRMDEEREAELDRRFGYVWIGVAALAVAAFLFLMLR